MHESLTRGLHHRVHDVFAIEDVPAIHRSDGVFRFCAEKTLLAIHGATLRPAGVLPSGMLRCCFRPAPAGLPHQPQTASACPVCGPHRVCPPAFRPCWRGMIDRLAEPEIAWWLPPSGVSVDGLLLLVQRIRCQRNTLVSAWAGSGVNGVEHGLQVLGACEERLRFGARKSQRMAETDFAIGRPIVLSAKLESD